LQQIVAGDDVVDVARLSEHDWLRLTRAHVTGSGVVTGLTGWQDFVTARDLFREAGFWQSRPERRIDLPTGATLFDWKLSR
jgi:hypothetical protein